MKTRMLSRIAIAVLALFALTNTVPALAQHGGGGGGHSGGFHGGGGGGFHAGGALHGGASGFRGGSASRGAVGGFRGSGYRGGSYGGLHNGHNYGWGRDGFGRGHGGYAWGGYGGAGLLGYGLLFAALPLAYDTYYWDGVPYYYADDNYYQWDGAANEYETVEPPDEVASQVAAAGQTDPSPIDLYAYPMTGQSVEKQTKDRADCQQWAREQAGADATQHANYLKAEAACLTGKGYSVR